jgi:tetratricopeptide (TPR) repeat protein
MQATTALARALEAARRGDVESLGRLASMRLTTGNPDMDEDRALFSSQIGALLLRAEGKTDSAVAVLRAAVAVEAAQPIDFGPPIMLRPAHEALAELLLEAGKFGEAKTAYDRALARTPGRARTLAGLSMAARLAGDTAASDRTMSQLEGNFHDADPGALEALMGSLRVP